MAAYSDISALPGRWTAIPASTEETIISPISGNVRISSDEDGISAGIMFPADSAHLVRVNTALWVRPTGQAPVTIVRITA